MSSRFLLLLCVSCLLYMEIEASGCKVKCTIGGSSPTWFSIPSKGDIILKRTHCNVTSTDQSICHVDINDMLGAVLNDADNVVHYNTLTCVDLSVRVLFKNPSNISNKQVIGYLFSSNCDVHWTDMAFYADAINLRVIYLEKWTEKFEEERESFERISTIHLDGLNELPPSLQTVGTLWLMKSTSGTLPYVLQNYLWPNMAEVIFNDLSLQAIPDELQQTMPILQSLELPQNQLEQPPSFPWNDEWRNLPLNLSRTANGNHHYTVSQGFETEPNLYRRVILLTNNNITDLKNYIFKGCLQKINLANNQIKSFSSETFNSVECLQRIDLSHNKLTHIPSFAFESLDSLTSIDFSNNQIEMVLSRDVFIGLKKLQKLDLSFNLIHTIQDMAFHPLLELAQINMAENKLHTIPNNAVYSDANKLIKVNFEGNNMTHIPHWVFLLRNLQDVNLKNNHLDFNYFLRSINDLDPRHIVFNNRWSASQYSIVPQRAQTKYIYMQHNYFDSLDISEMDNQQIQILNTILLFFNLDISSNSLTCDCRMYSMYEYLRNQIKKAQASPNADHNSYAADNWLCYYPASVRGNPISKVHNSTFKCQQPDLPGCPEQCDCYVRSVDNVVEVDCSRKGLKTLPKNLPNNTQILNMAYNVLNKLDNPPYYIHHLTKVDFSHNNISNVAIDFVSSLNKTEVLLHYNKLSSLPSTLEDIEMEGVSLRYNRWACDCNAVWFKQWLLANRHVVEDIDDVLCFSGRTPGDEIILVPDADFICEVPTSVVVAKSVLSIAAVVLVFLIVFLLVYRYRGEIKVFLYVHFKWHPFDRSESTDIDFVYDAFVSYAGDDYKWVVYKLVARLESHIPPFKLCLHDRDFEVGAPIEQNIMQAVKKSRRMIVVLTRNFLRSDWCLLEFRAAHERVLHDRSNYIIMVLFEDDLSVSDLEDDMQLYVRTNTYLSVSNKWFWEKLDYAMPKQPICTLRDDITFDFPRLTEPPKKDKEYMKGYIAKNKILPNKEIEEDKNEDSNANHRLAICQA